MLFRDIIAGCSMNDKKPAYTLYGQNAQLLIVKAGVTSELLMAVNMSVMF
jgi:hypothetical protein